MNCPRWLCGGNPPIDNGGGPQPPPDPTKPNPWDFQGLKDILSNLVNDSSISYKELADGAEIFKEKGYIDHAELVFKSLPSAALFRDNVAPIDVSVRLISYARMLDSLPGRRNEATMLIDMALLNLHKRA